MDRLGRNLKAARFVKRDKLSFCRSLQRTRLRGIFVQSQMSPNLMII
jgi:hypothetical protein